MGTLAARFTKAQRLLTRAHFDRVQNGRGSRKAASAHFVVLVSASPGTARLGMIASRRVGSAVRRNRAKRMIRQYFRTHAPELGSFDVVVVVKTGASDLAQRDVDAELASAFSRLGLTVPPKATK